MPKGTVIYYSRSGHVQRMAEAVAEGARLVRGMDAQALPVAEATPQLLLEQDMLVLGSPTYFGQMAAEMKEFIDQSIKVFGKLNGKVGGAFASSGGIAGGNETTVLSLLEALLVHGMVVQGVVQGSHYGPVAVGKPSPAVLGECRTYGEMLAKLVMRMSGEPS